MPPDLSIYDIFIRGKRVRLRDQGVCVFVVIFVYVFVLDWI